MKLQEVIRNVTEKPHDIRILHFLNDFRKQFSSIRETAYLKDFAKLKTFKGHNPKYTIRDTLIIYLRSVCDIYKQPNLLQLITFTYHDDHGVHVYKYSNYMMFSDDITIICFIYYMLKKFTYEKCETLQYLKSLMINKYEIDIEQEKDIESSKNKVTLCNIALSYPSIAFEIIFKMIRSKILHVFHNFLPEVIFFPPIVSLLPVLDEAPPFAIIMLTKLKIAISNGFDITTIKLNLLFNSIYESYKSEIFPEDLKLELCKKWQVVEEKNNTYKYNPSFEKHRQTIKDTIADMIQNHPDLEALLSRL